MSTLIPFVPSATASPPFQTIFTLDGNAYSGAVTWNLAGQRWYLTVSDQDGNLIMSQPLIGSPLTSDINLLPGQFTTSTLVYRTDTGNFEVTP